MRYLTKEQILLIHSMVVDETGGSHGVRDHHTVLSMENAPRQSAFGKDLYPSVFEKAALYARDIIMNHPFIDGNKRTGMTCAIVFLEDNGYRYQGAEGAIENFALKIVREKLSVKEIAKWLKSNSVKTKQ